jgi:hypothetical protein
VVLQDRGILHRATAAILAAFSSIAFLTLFQPIVGPRTASGHPNKVTYLAIVQPPSPPARSVEVQRRTLRQLSPPTFRASTSSPDVQHQAAPLPASKPTGLIPPLDVTTPGQLAEQALPAAHAASSPSAPLDVSPSALRAAARAARSDVRLLAEAAGVQLSDQPLSAEESLARAVSHAGKSDCLGPNSSGSLLSVFILPYLAVSGKCK